MSTEKLESLIDYTGQLYAEFGPAASYNRLYKAGIQHRLLVKRGRVWHVPAENKPRLRAALLAMPRRPIRSAAP